jgi:uncharacterized protein (TIGR01777 family)
MKIAMAGASGMIGTALRERLGKAGHEVVALKRNHGSSSPSGTASGQPAFVDVTPDYLSTFDGVVNFAGENIAGGRWTEEQKKRIIESRVQTTEFLAKTLNETSGTPSVFVNASAIGYYGNREGEVVDEQSPAGSGFLADTCKQWESAADKANRQGLRVVKARIGVVISKKGGALSKMLLPFQMGGGGILGSGKQYMSWIDIDDITRAFEKLLTDDSLRGPVNLVAPNAVTNEQFTKAMGQVLHRPTILPAPAFALKLILGDMAQEMLLEGAHVKPAKLEAAGFKFDYPSVVQSLEKETK